jgi:(R,R)-butanediol dehydrogenase/meso-butanediol dehydrogenase/diacetyl reductase
LNEKMMKAVAYHSNDKPLSIEDIPVPEPGPGQLLLKVSACGICGSDLHAYQAGLAPEGNVFGHEFAGEVAAVGEGAGEDWQPGDRATSVGVIVCGQCPKCTLGMMDQCEKIELIGFSRHGAYAEYVITQAASSVKIPDGIPWSQAALVEPLAVGLAAYRDCQLALGGNVLILGAGIIGITVVKWARFFGAEHVAISDLDSARLQRAERVGATASINAADQADAVQAFRDSTGVEPDVIVECVGRPMLQHLVDTAPHGAHIVSVGASMEQDSIAPWTAAAKKIRLTFSFGYTPEDFQFILRMMEGGRLDTDHLITRRISLHQVPEAFAGLLEPNDHCKIMIEPH